MHINVMNMQHDEKLGYSVRELSKRVGICERKIWQEIKDGKLQVVKFGTRTVIPASSVDLWFAEAAETK